MHLEVVEQRCLNYLQQASSPIVPIPRLLEYLRQFDDCKHVALEELTDFLREHGLFRVFEPLPIDPAMAHSLCISTDRRVLLATRVPTSAETHAAMSESLDVLSQTLGSAMRDAEERNDDALRQNVESLLRRVEALRKALAASA